MRLLSLLCLFALTHALQLSPAPHTKPLTRRAVAAMRLEAPAEIREAEAKTPAAEGRGLRLVGFAALGSLSVVTGLFFLSAVAGVEATQETAELVAPFGSLYLGIALDGGVLATCFWLWRQEVTTREENVQRIWAEVLRRQEAGEGPGMKKKKPGFTKKRKASRGSTAPATGGFAATPTSPPAATAAPPPAATEAPAATATKEEASGLQKMWNNIYEEADAMGRAQALTLNSALEERGVLPKLQDAAEQDADAPEALATSTTAPAADAGVAKAGAPKTTSKKKKKAKKKR